MTWNKLASLDNTSEDWQKKWELSENVQREKMKKAKTIENPQERKNAMLFVMREGLILLEIRLKEMGVTV